MGNKLKLPATIRLAIEEEPQKHQAKSVKNLHDKISFQSPISCFSVCFDFLTALTDQLVQCFQSDDSPKSYLKILDENGIWKRNNGY